MSKKEKNCLNCRIHWDHEGGCEICRWEDNDNPSLFYQITRSPGVLAEKLVYGVEKYSPFYEDYVTRWYSSIIPYTVFNTKPEAIAATLAELKGVTR